MAPETIDVLGVRFHALKRKDAAEAVVALARSGGKHYVVKPYSEFMPAAHGDEYIQWLLNGASLCLADGTGILWAAHYLAGPSSGLRALIAFPASLISLLTNNPVVRKPLPQPMRGVDFTWEMLEALSDEKLSVYLVGGTEEEVEGAAAVIRQRLPALDVRGARQGHFRTSGSENEAVVTAINEAAPDVLLVGMGFPRQERWIVENVVQGDLGVKVAVAEGGSFSFISGTTRRAPAWMRRAGLEWLYRLGRQPGRIGRQMAIPRFAWLVLRARMTRRL